MICKASYGRFPGFSKNFLIISVPPVDAHSWQRKGTLALSVAFLSSASAASELLGVAQGDTDYL